MKIKKENTELGNLRASFISLTGIDGSGKSTQSLRLLEILKSQGIKARYVYLRTPRFFTKVLVLISYLLGATEFIKDSKGNDLRGYHHFYRYNLLSLFYMWLQALDLYIYTLKEIRVPRLLGWTVICDRYIADTLVDVILETKKICSPDSLLWNFYMSLYPKDSKLFVLHGDRNFIRSRKKDIAFDKWFDAKLVYLFIFL